MAVVGVGSMGVMNWMPTFFIRKFQVTTTEIGAWSAAGSSIPYTISILAAGIISDRLYRKDPRWSVRMPALGLAAAAPFVVIQLLMPSLPAAILVGVMPSFAAGLIGPPLMAIGQALSGSRFRSLSVAFMSLASYLVGMGIGPSLTGVISQLTLPLVEGDPLKSLGVAIGSATILYFAGAIILYKGSKTVPQDIERAREYDRLRT
jgi:MFS family permease